MKIYYPQQLLTYFYVWFMDHFLYSTAYNQPSVDSKLKQLHGMAAYAKANSKFLNFNQYIN